MHLSHKYWQPQERVINWHEEGGMSFEQISDILGISRESARQIVLGAKRDRREKSLLRERRETPG
jgi:transposase